MKPANRQKWDIVAILDKIAGAIAKAAGKSEYSGGDNKFWEDALHHMNTNLVDHRWHRVDSVPIPKS